MRIFAFDEQRCGFSHLAGDRCVFLRRAAEFVFCARRRICAAAHRREKFRKSLRAKRGNARTKQKKPPLEERERPHKAEKASARREGAPAQSRKSLRAKRRSARTKQKKAPARNGLCLQKFTAFEGRFECGCKIINRSVVNFWLWAFFLRCSMPTLRKGSAKKPTDFLLKGQKMPLPSTISPSGARSLRFPSASSAHKIIPSLTIPRNLAGLRLVIITTFLPTICSGV